MTGERRRTIQPRHRAQDGSLLGFNRNLQPTDDEWAVDRLEILLTGHWESRSRGSEFFQNTLGFTNLGWLTVPTTRGTWLFVQTRNDANLTLFMKLTARKIHQSAGTFSIEIVCNPTKTLSHLLAQSPPGTDLPTFLAALEPEEFFASVDGPYPARSLDQKTNWIDNPRRLREQLSGDFHDGFLPLFLNNLKLLVERFLGDLRDGSSDSDCDRLVTVENGQFLVRWGQVKVPQIESYFERHHSSAAAAVRRAAMQVLSADHQNWITQYRGDLQMARDADRFSLTMPISEPRKLVIYAKTERRIRFEIRRDGKGRYGRPTSVSAPLDRIAHILRIERTLAAACCNWDQVGALFDDADGSSLADLARFLNLVSGICSVTGFSVGAVVESLITHGSLAHVSGDRAKAATIRKLIAAGIVAATPVRTTDRRNAVKRFALADRYQDLTQQLHNAFGAAHDNKN